MSALPDSAEVVVVGGGVIGTSIAFHLAEAGVDVCLLERDQLAGGSTSRAAGGVRAQFSDPLNIAIGLRSIEAFERFGERPGGEIDLHQVGYLFLLDRAADVAAFEASVALQQELGVPSRFVSLDEVVDLSPLAALDGVLAATFCPLDGHASPEAVTQGYAAGARAHGGTVLTGCAVAGVELAGDEIQAVETELGRIVAQTVVCAAGVWSPELARSVGVELPVQPYLREVGFTGPVSGLPERIPLTIDFSTGFYFHGEGPGLLFGMADPEQPTRFRRTDEPGLARAGAGGRRAPVPVAPRHGHRRWLEGLLRGDAGPQRARRRVDGREPLPLRDRLLRARLPAGPCRGRDRA